MSYFTRLRDPILSLLKEEAAPAGQGEAVRDRAEAARRAWEVRRARYGPGGGNVGKGGGKGKVGDGRTPASIRKDLTYAATDLLAQVANKPGKLGDAIPWKKRLGADKKGKSPAGFITNRGTEYFAKVSEIGEAEVEEAVTNAADALGWADLTRPTKSFVARGDPSDRSAENAISVQPLLPAGDQMRMRSSDQIKVDPDKLERMKIFEYAIGAVDRHGGNYWVDNKTGNVHGIDYARSFYRTSAAEEVRFGGTGNSDKWEGIWGRSATKSNLISRKHIQKVIDNVEGIIAAIPANGGFRTTKGQAESAVRERIIKLKELLAKNKSERIDLKTEGLWR